MKRILFICHGNICRSPMAEFVMKNLVKEAHLEEKIYIESKATSREELGNPVYPPAKKELARHGIKAEGHHARQMTLNDYSNFDLLIGMDSYNITNIKRITGPDLQNKIHRLLDFTETPEDISDPWYSGRFEITYTLIEKGCQALLTTLRKEL